MGRQLKVTGGTGAQQKSAPQTIGKAVQRRAISCLSRAWVTGAAQGIRWSTVSTLPSIHTNACQSTKLNTRAAEFVNGTAPRFCGVHRARASFSLKSLVYDHVQCIVC